MLRKHNRKHGDITPTGTLERENGHDRLSCEETLLGRVFNGAASQAEGIPSEKDRLIRFARRVGRRAIRRGAEGFIDAWAAGQALKALKKTIPHGRKLKAKEKGWQQFVTKKLGFSTRTASRWMKLAGDFPTLEAVKTHLLKSSGSRDKCAASGSRGSEEGTAENADAKLSIDKIEKAINTVRSRLTCKVGELNDKVKMLTEFSFRVPNRVRRIARETLTEVETLQQQIDKLRETADQLLHKISPKSA